MDSEIHVEVETWVPRDGTMTVLKQEEAEAYINRIGSKDGNKQYIKDDEARQEQSNEIGCSVSQSPASYVHDREEQTIYR